MSAVNVRNVLVLMGIIVTVMGLVYFATEFIDVISDWGRVMAFVLLATVFVSLGIHFSTTGDATEVVERTGWRWLRVTNALYILGAVCAGGSVVAFFVVDDLDRLVKVLVTIGLGLGLILAAARRVEKRKA